MKLHLSTPLTFLLLSPAALAQWSSDAASNLSVADGAGEQVQAKIAPTADGGCYVSWLDGGAGYDVRLQRLDAEGNELWAHNGVLVADRGFSSTQDYGLDVDASGAALLTYRDDSSGSVGIGAQRVTSTGTLAWGAGGILMPSGAGATVLAPKIAGTQDGEVVVAWSEIGAVVGSRVLRFTSGGVPSWGAPTDVVAPAGTYFVSDLHDSGNDAILSIVHQTGPQIFSPKHLVAQKFDDTGAASWGAQPVTVFDGGSLQIGNFPSFVGDGNGGAVFSWYSTSPLQCFAQHLLADGSEAFPSGGALGSTDATGTRVSPSVAYDGSSTYMFWTEMDAVQGDRGVSGQRFDASGNRQWGSTGQVVVPIGAQDIGFVNTRTSGGGVATGWLSSTGFGNDLVRGALLDASGSTTAGPLDLASTPSGKGRLTSATSATTGDTFFAWQDDRNDGGDVLAQNLRPDGGLGNGGPFSSFCQGVACPCANDDAGAGCENSTGSGAHLAGGGSGSAAADDFLALLNDAPPGQPVLLFFGDMQVNGGAGLPFGDGLRCVGGTVVRVSIQSASGSGSVSWGPGLGSTYGWSAGDSILLQAWYRDPVGGPCAGGFNLSNGLQVDVGP